MPFDKYETFLSQNGLKTAEYEESKLLVLNFQDSLKAVKLFKESSFIITGGDIYTENDNGIKPAFVICGSEYHCLDWYYDDNNIAESIDIAEQSIIEANKILQKSNRKCYTALYYK